MDESQILVPLTRQEITDTIECYNEGWGSRRDCEDVYQMFSNMINYLTSVSSSDDNTELLTKEKEYRAEWASLFDTLISNLDARAKQSNRIFDTESMSRLSCQLEENENSNFEAKFDSIEDNKLQCSKTELYLRLVSEKEFLEDCIAKYDEAISNEREKFHRVQKCIPK